jgi:hypothetical protein
MASLQNGVASPDHGPIVVVDAALHSDADGMVVTGQRGGSIEGCAKRRGTNK